MLRPLLLCAAVARSHHPSLHHAMSHVPRERPSLLTFSRQELALIAVTMIWGGTFLAVQMALTASGALFFVGLRFGVAALLAALVSFNVLRGLTLREVLAGASIGVCIFFGYALQTYG